jgi:hypothetical protein
MFQTVYRRNLCGALLAIMLGSACIPLAAQQYTFTKIADTSGMFNGLTFNTDGPSINSQGVVGFEAKLAAGGEGIYSGNGNTVTTLYDTNTSNFSTFYSPPVLNSSGDFAFCATLTNNSLGYFKSSNGNLLTLQILTSGISYAGMPSINDQGQVAFTNGAGDGTGNTNVYRSNGQTLTTIAQGEQILQQFGNAVVNAGGTVAFHGIGNSAQAVETGNGGPLSVLYDTSGQFSSFSNVDINSLSQVAFRAGLTAGGQGIYTGNGGPATAIATTGNIFSGFGSAPAINDSGEVAFIGNLKAGGSGLYTGPDPVADKVIATGDTLDGKTISSLEFWNNGLNNTGELAFTAIFSDNSMGVYRADFASVPEASTTVTACILLLCGGVLVRRRGSAQ